LAAEGLAAHEAMDVPAESFAEALSYFPNPENFRLGPDDYLEQIFKIKTTVKVPIIASLNGATTGGWLNYAELIEQAGADAIELNVYYLATDPAETADNLEKRTIDMLLQVKKSVNIPVAVKLSPFYTSFSNFARKLDEIGTDGLILFNRFYQPDIDTDALEVQRRLSLSDSSELLLRLRWLAVLSGKINASLAVTGGVHTGLDAVKAIMCGADAIQMVSALLLEGPQHLKQVRDDLVRWLEQHEYNSLYELHGSLNLLHCPDPGAYERANYIQLLQSWTASQ